MVLPWGLSCFLAQTLFGVGGALPQKEMFKSPDLPNLGTLGMGMNLFPAPPKVEASVPEETSSIWSRLGGGQKREPFAVETPVFFSAIGEAPKRSLADSFGGFWGGSKAVASFDPFAATSAFGRPGDVFRPQQQGDFRDDSVRNPFQRTSDPAPVALSRAPAPPLAPPSDPVPVAAVKPAPVRVQVDAPAPPRTAPSNVSPPPPSEPAPAMAPPPEVVIQMPSSPQTVPVHLDPAPPFPPGLSGSSESKEGGQEEPLLPLPPAKVELSEEEKEKRRKEREAKALMPIGAKSKKKQRRLYQPGGLLILI